jgi:copper chaperone CopZ
MRIRSACCLALALLVMASVSIAQTPQAATTKISLAKLHCQGCAKKVAGQLTQVAGVESVQGDLPTATLVVTHKPGMLPSPKAMWEAVEKANHVPTKLEGPAGTFTARPGA